MEETVISLVGGGVTAPAGFAAGGVAAGIKRTGLDLAVLHADRPCAAAGVFTRNRVKAAPVLLDMERLPGGSGTARTVVMNSGNANACNGPRGMADARSCAREAGRLLGVPEEQVLVASTGVIGMPLPLDNLLRGLGGACAQLSREGGALAARAIMTTDTRPKERAAAFSAGGRLVTVGGMAKGSGMIHPDMATMLCFLTTDARVEAGDLRLLLSAAVEDTFNMITVDGDTSTNDLVLCLAAGEGPPLSKSGDLDFLDVALRLVCRELARDCAADGEGAGHLITVEAAGAASLGDARSCARRVAASSLVKTAVTGADANWGRVLCAAGYSGAVFDPDKAHVWLGDLLVAAGGAALAFDEDLARRILRRPEVTIRVDLGAGPYSATAWGCDLTEEYVRINASYRS
ncbi:MAG: bifunctional glutamate N-acetyltransferase/amino-acid acetyltransferase ArgJ [Peptococcaceae bacterium]|nr:bifunctional glutamate N-acetyltransferase/amino-acid acetyltransferase ArgJ [Peptococcaceae bacterium]